MLSLCFGFEPGGMRVSQVMFETHRISTPLETNRAVMEQVFLDDSITGQIDPLMCLKFL